MAIVAHSGSQYFTPIRGTSGKVRNHGGRESVAYHLDDCDIFVDVREIVVVLNS
jgi:hypothetical protein